jgi:hypothetical protein
MFSFANVVLGLLGFGGGVAMIYFAFYLNHQVFYLDFIEKRYGGGSGTTAYRLIGLLVCIFAMFVIIGRIDLYGTAFGGGQTPGSNSANSSQTQKKTTPAITNTGGSLIGQ